MRIAILVAQGALVVAGLSYSLEALGQAPVTCAAGAKCEGNPDLSSAKFELKLSGCSSQQLTIGYYASDEAERSVDSDSITCATKAKDGEVTTYECVIPPGLRHGHTSGVLKFNANCGGNPNTLFKIVLAGPGEPSDTAAPPFLPKSAWQRVLSELGLPLAGKSPGNYYNRGRDVAVLFFDADGDSYYPLPDVIDEDDDIYVVVADRQSRLANTSIAIQGCNRPPSEPRVFGTTSAEGGTKGTAKPAEPIQFVIRSVGKCAGSDNGGPQVVITRNGRQHAQTVPINQLYRLAVGVAAAFDATRQREFALRTLPGETVPRIARDREPLGLTSLVYISFYPSARDFRKTYWALGQRIQLFVGLDPRAFDKHLVVGAGYELTMGLNALVGWRILTRQKVLAEGSGLAPGMRFDGDARDLPTRERWEIGSVFVGVGLSSSLLARLK